MIGLGLILFVVHNPYQPLLEYAFLPWIGLLLLIFGSMVIIAGIKDWKEAIGEKRYWIPLGIIALSIVASALWAWVESRIMIQEAIGRICIGIMLFVLYTATRQTDSDKVFKIFPAVVVISSVSIVVWGATHGWIANGGIVSPTNYDMATGVVIFSILASPRKHWTWLAPIGAIGLWYSGSAEAQFIGIVLLVYAIFNGVNWKQLNVTVTSLAIVVVLTAVLGVISTVQRPNLDRIGYLVSVATTDSEVTRPDGIPTTKMDAITGYRLSHFLPRTPIKPFGYGINLTNFYWGIPHNVFTIIVDQVGILACLAWTWIAYLGIKKKDTRVLWIGIVALGIFDHFIWTQAAPWFWATAGITSVRRI